MKELDIDPKYALKPPKDLRSKFLMQMEQRKLDKIRDEEMKKEEALKLEMQV